MSCKFQITMTRNTADLEQHIHKAHLIRQLGGSNEWKWEYEGVIDGENECMKDTKTKKKLLAHREKLVALFDKTTREWAENGDAKVAKRRQYIKYMMRIQYCELVRGLLFRSPKGHPRADARA